MGKQIETRLELTHRWSMVSIEHLERRSPADGLGELGVECGVIGQGEGDEEKVGNDRCDSVQLGCGNEGNQTRKREQSMNASRGEAQHEHLPIQMKTSDRMKVKA